MELDASNKDVIIGWCVFGGMLVFFNTPLIFMLVWRKHRYIKIRNMPLIAEILMPSSVSASISFTSILRLRFSLCRVYETIYVIHALKCILPFLLLYRHFYNIYRYGAVVESHSSEEATQGRQFRRSILSNFALKYCARDPNFPRKARIFEFTVLVSSIVVCQKFISHHEDTELDQFYMCGGKFHGHLTTKYFFFELICIGAPFASICLLLGRGLVEELRRIGKQGDHLGIKRMLYSSNRSLLVMSAFVTVAYWLSTFGITSMYPVHLCCLTGYVTVCHVLCWNPLLHVWRTRHEIIMRESLDAAGHCASELDLLEAFVNSTEGYALLLPFFKAELCVEILMFIRDVSTFEAKFNERLLSGNQGSLIYKDGGKVQQGSKISSQVETMGGVLAYESYLRVKAKEVKRIYEKYIQAGAPYEINSESAHCLEVQNLVNSVPVQSLLRAQDKKQKSFTHLRLGSRKTFPEDTVSKETNAPKIIDNPIPTDCFQKLKTEQLELMLMDLFNRFCQASPIQGQAWRSFCDRQREIELLQASQANEKDKMSHTSTSGVVQSSTNIID